VDRRQLLIIFLNGRIREEDTRLRVVSSLFRFLFQDRCAFGRPFLPRVLSLGLTGLMGIRFVVFRLQVQFKIWLRVHFGLVFLLGGLIGNLQFFQSFKRFYLEDQLVFPRIHQFFLKFLVQSDDQSVQLVTFLRLVTDALCLT
jgi:hypothetical protein